MYAIVASGRVFSEVESAVRLTGLQSWFHLNELHREKLLSLNKKLPAFWKKVQKKYAEPKTFGA